LTGRFARFEDLPADDYRRNNPRFQGDNFDKNLDLVAKVKLLAREKGCTPSQLAWRGCSRRARTIVPIPGTKRRKYLEEKHPRDGRGARTRRSATARRGGALGVAAACATLKGACAPSTGERSRRSLRGLGRVRARAQRGGASRIELCDNLVGGRHHTSAGTMPCAATVSASPSMS